jgi:methylenetetrahydrofolate/methylenetetrahydromethanopterin dehydrogenase (NADP+)
MKPKILIQLDSDKHPSVFDAVVATDAGVDRLLQYGSVENGDVRGLVHGAIFTRGPQDLLNTAIFIGGSSVEVGEALLAEATAAFFGPMRVSVLLDANGANTTAAAAVLAAAKHVDLRGVTAVVLGGTGPVGERAALLLARQGALVAVSSRNYARAKETCARISAKIPGAELIPVESGSAASVVLDGAIVVIAAGAAGVELIPKEAWQDCDSLRVAVDLNAVPPVGIAGIEITDKAKERDGVICYGAISVGGMKMKIHRTAIQKLFTSNNLVLDAEQVFEIGKELS